MSDRNPVKEQKPRILVWYDPIRNTICLCDQREVDEKVKAGEVIPEEFIIRVRVEDSPELMDGLIHARFDEPELWKVIEAVQRVLDQRAALAVTVAERLRLEWVKKTGGVMTKNNQEMICRADHLTRLKMLHAKMRRLDWDLILATVPTEKRAMYQEAVDELERLETYEPGPIFVPKTPKAGDVEGRH
jgi:hypothetical protein